MNFYVLKFQVIHSGTDIHYPNANAHLAAGNKVIKSPVKYGI